MSVPTKPKKKPFVFEVDFDTIQPKDQFVTPKASASFSYGDGGECCTQFDRIAVCPQLLPPETVTEIAQEMRNLAERKAKVSNTIQQNGVVEDLVDPDYFPAFRTPEMMAKTKELARQAYRFIGPGAEGNSDDDVWYDERSEFLNDLDYESSKRDLLTLEENRGKYHWIPALVQWDAKKKTAKFTSSIQNLPRTKNNARLYALLEQALTKTFPEMLAKAKETKPDYYRRCATGRPPAPPDPRTVSGTHKVVVKLQRYNVPPRASYKGKWHTEGVCENVQSVGVLYTEWPKELTGGELKFRPYGLPDDHYREHLYEAQDLNVVVPTREGSAVAFGNLPHRFQQLTNDTDRVLQRAFVNFFLVDPTLPSMQEVPTNADVALAILKKTNYDVVDVVLQFVGATPRSIEEAASLRDKAKAEMVAKRGKWGYCNHGNSGEIHWLSTGGEHYTKMKYSDYRVQVHCKESANEPGESLTSGN